MTTPRRTQDQRRAETRSRLLDATIACVEEYGYTAATTRRIAERAEVSVGAVTHHFQYRVELVTAAVEELMRRRLIAIREALDELPETGREARVGEALEFLWQDFSGPLFTVMIKLWVAAGDDTELYERMVPLERMLARAFAEFAPEFGLPDPPSSAAAPGTPALAVNPRYVIVIAALRGLALSRAFEPRTGTIRDPWPALRAELERYLLN